MPKLPNSENHMLSTTESACYVNTIVNGPADNNSVNGSRSLESPYAGLRKKGIRRPTL